MRDTRLSLVGGGGEPVDFRRTLASHGVATLPPNIVDEEAWKVRATSGVDGLAAWAPPVPAAFLMPEDLLG